MSVQILMSTYNGAKYLKDQIDSILQQDYSDFQVVGQNEVVGYEPNTVDLAKNLHELAKQTSIVQNVDALVPRYLKDVEAKKICL